MHQLQSEGDDEPMRRNEPKQLTACRVSSTFPRTQPTVTSNCSSHNASVGTRKTDSASADLRSDTSPALGGLTSLFGGVTFKLFEHLRRRRAAGIQENVGINFIGRGRFYFWDNLPLFSHPGLLTFLHCEKEHKHEHPSSHRLTDRLNAVKET